MKVQLASLVLFVATTLAGDPRLDSWLTTNSGKYARIYTTPANQAAGNAVSTWSNGTQTQALPAYAGVQELFSSPLWVYIRTTGLGSHTMGPWANGNFPNLPVNRKALYRLPRVPNVPVTKTLTGLGVIGYLVDGVALYDGRDAFVWNGTSETPNGTGYWNREAYVNEGSTFDPAMAHQEPTGTYHYHASPVALRYLLGDHMTYNSGTKTYKEASTPVERHSPLLGWVRDGFPIYGPYGYSMTNGSGGLSRMLSGYQLRNGQRGSDTLTDRATLPAWAQRLYGVSAGQRGPVVSTAYPLGRYMEDNAFLGDLTNALTGKAYLQGVDFDLDVSNGRWCVTPEYPEGTYAYFVTIATDGTPVFPYNIGRAFHGSPTGTAVTTFSEAVSTNFVGGPTSSLVSSLTPSTGAQVTLRWTAVEGGSYQIESSTNLAVWTTNATAVAVTGSFGSNSVTTMAAPHSFYRIRQTELATYDSAVGTADNGGGGGPGPNGGGGMGPIEQPLASVSPPSAALGTVLTVTFTLGGMVPPPEIIPSSALLGTLTGTSVRRASPTTVTANFSLPANAAAGPVNAAVVFPGPPGMGSVTFSLANGFIFR